jgi:hypothetical protein
MAFGLLIYEGSLSLEIVATTLVEMPIYGVHESLNEFAGLAEQEENCRTR